MDSAFFSPGWSYCTPLFLDLHLSKLFTIQNTIAFDKERSSIHRKVASVQDTTTGSKSDYTIDNFLSDTIGWIKTLNNIMQPNSTLTCTKQRGCDTRTDTHFTELDTPHSREIDYEEPMIVQHTMTPQDTVTLVIPEEKSSNIEINYENQVIPHFGDDVSLLDTYISNADKVLVCASKFTADMATNIMVKIPADLIVGYSQKYNKACKQYSGERFVALHRWCDQPTIHTKKHIGNYIVFLRKNEQEYLVPYAVWLGELARRNTPNDTIGLYLVNANIANYYSEHFHNTKKSMDV